MANPSGVSLAKSGSSRSVAEKFAEARAATRAPGMGAAAAAQFKRAAVDGRHAAADSLAAKLRAHGLTATEVWRPKGDRTGSSPLRIYVKEPASASGFRRGTIDHGFITVDGKGVPHVGNVRLSSNTASKAFKALKL